MGEHVEGLDGLDAAALRRWCRAGFEALGRAREEIDALNVYPVPDSDTGTNLFLTFEAIVEAVEAAAGEPGSADDLASAAEAMAHGALLGARGNSGVIVSQFLRGAADVLVASPLGSTADVVRAAFERAFELGYDAVAAPMEGTLLTVMREAARAANATTGDDLGTVVRAALDAAESALSHTPEQLDALARAGVVDAGGRGLCVLLDALVSVVSGRAPRRQVQAALPSPKLTETYDPEGPAFEVMYLLDAAPAAIAPLKSTLAKLGDCLFVVGGGTTWNVHVHVDDVGAAVEAGMSAGRPYRIQVTHFGEQAARRGDARGRSETRAVVAASIGPGLSSLYEASGAVVVASDLGGEPSTRAFLDAIQRAHANEVVILPHQPNAHAVAEAAAEQARADGVRVSVIPTKSAVQVLAALAVHEPARRLEDDVVAMTAAARATRNGAVGIATREALTMAGVCHPGDMLGVLEGDVALIGSDVAEVSQELLDRMLRAGGELVTLIAGAGTNSELMDKLNAHVHRRYGGVDVTAYEGGQKNALLIIGVE